MGVFKDIHNINHPYTHMQRHDRFYFLYGVTTDVYGFTCHRETVAKITRYGQVYRDDKLTVDVSVVGGRETVTLFLTVELCVCVFTDRQTLKSIAICTARERILMMLSDSYITLCPVVHLRDRSSMWNKRSLILNNSKTLSKFQW